MQLASECSTMEHGVGAQVMLEMYPSLPDMQICGFLLSSILTAYLGFELESF